MKITVIEKAVEPMKVTLNEKEMNTILGGTTVCTPYNSSPCAWYSTCGTQPAGAVAQMEVQAANYSDTGSGTICTEFYSWKEWCWRA